MGRAEQAQQQDCWDKHGAPDQAQAQTSQGDERQQERLPQLPCFPPRLSEAQQALLLKQGAAFELLQSFQSQQLLSPRSSGLALPHPLSDHWNAAALWHSVLLSDVPAAPACSAVHVMRLTQ